MSKALARALVGVGLISIATAIAHGAVAGVFTWFLMTGILLVLNGFSGWAEK